MIVLSIIQKYNFNSFLLNKKGFDNLHPVYCTKTYNETYITQVYGSLSKILVKHKKCDISFYTNRTVSLLVFWIKFKGFPISEIFVIQIHTKKSYKYVKMFVFNYYQ